jgi:N-acetylglutamate synthase-like GNAT family acetyltransferase
MILNQEPTRISGDLQAPLDAAVELTSYTGFSFQVRSADKSDEPVLAEFFTHVTQDDLRFRFLSAIQKIGRAQLSLLTHADDRDVQNFLAFDMVTGCMLASAILAIDEGHERAEVAIVIRSDFKNRGMGWSLLQHVSRRAAAMGVKTLQSIESQDNRSAIQVERDMGFTSRPYPGDPTLTLLEKSLAEPSLEEAERSAA